MNRRERRRQEKLARRAAPGPAAGATAARAATPPTPGDRADPMAEAAALRAAGRADQAAALYTKLLDADPDNVEALYRLGMMRAAAGAINEARDLLRRAVEIDPHFADGFSDLGVLCRRLGDGDGARAAYGRALALNPAHVDALFNFGNLLSAAGETAEAAALYRRAIAARPSHQGALNNLGLMLQRSGDSAGAAELFRQALAHDGSQAKTHNNLGNALRESGAMREAAASHRRAVELDPDFCDGWRNLSVALQKLHLMEEAVEPARRALALQPDNPELLLNLGTLMVRLGRIEQGAAAFDAALAINPGYAEAHWNRSHILLLHGDFRAGWREYEWRLRCPGLNAYGRTFEAPRWDGAPLDGRRILIHSEQGFGDTLQFVRFLPLVKARIEAGGGTVIFETPPPLTRLFDGLAGVDEPVETGSSLPAFDCYAPLLSLPFLFGTEQATIPAAPRLTPPPPASLPDSGKKRIGLVWAGRPSHGNDRNRSMTLAALAPLLANAACDFVSLQLGPARGQIAELGLQSRIADPAELLTDFAATASVIGALDLVIAVDTAVAHLAGTLGKPVWLLLPHVPDWRWMLNRSDTPWYPTMRLFRQKAAGAWDRVVAEVATALQDFARR